MTGMPTEHASIVRVARFRPAAGQRDALLNRLQGGVDGIRQRDGCFGAQICGLREEPETIAVISRWSNQAALDSFLAESADQRAGASAFTQGPATTETFVSL
jgi:quinol monooxygenase YgiN